MIGKLLVTIFFGTLWVYFVVAAALQIHGLVEPLASWYWQVLWIIAGGAFAWGNTVNGFTGDDDDD